MSWYPRISTGKLQAYRALPKIDLHRHLEGSLRLDTVVEVARRYSLTLPASLAALVQVQHSDPLTVHNFLAKFQTLRQIYRSPEVIARVTAEAVQDAAADGVRHLELRFTPAALARVQDYPLDDVIDWVASSAAEAAGRYRVSVCLIASVNRHEPPALAERVARAAAEHLARAGGGAAPGVVGLDLAGNEAEFAAEPFEGLFREARQAGLRITAHAGEWAGAGSVRHAVERLGAERIGHGVRAVEDPAVTALLRERGTALEVCLTSNYQSGVVASLAEHPLPRLIEAGLAVTINSDDPGISRITLSDEYRLALEDLGMPPAVLAGCLRAAARAAFLPEDQRARLQDTVDASFDSIIGGT